MKLHKYITETFTIALAFSINTSFSQTSIHFANELSLSQVQQLAIKEHKYIFLDCYTTWCGPCKRMEKEAYTQANIIDFVNTHFVSLKLQMDSSDQDTKQTKQWYNDARRIAQEYHVSSYPTLLFISPEGRLVHRGVGYANPEHVLTLMKQALDTNEQIYTLLNLYRIHRLEYNRMRTLIRQLQNLEEKEAAEQIADDYLQNYLFKENMDSLFTPANMDFILRQIHNSRSIAFRWSYEHSGKIDSVLHEALAEPTLRVYISREELKPKLAKWDSLHRTDITNKDWKSIYRSINKQYNDAYAARIVLDGKIQWYSKHQDWKKTVKYYVTKLEKYGFDTTGWNVSSTNNMIYYVVFMHGKKISDMKKAIKWMEIICRANPNEQDFLDTYANLLYRTGNTAKAITMEEKAAKMHSANGDTTEIDNNLTKMRSGKPTWATK